LHEVKLVRPVQTTNFRVTLRNSQVYFQSSVYHITVSC